MSAHRTAHISEIEQRLIDGDVWRPVRHTLGVTGFGVNLFAARKAGDEAIEDHTEIEENCGRHEELYFVVSGHAEFTVDGETVDAPAGTFVFVPDPASRRRAVGREADTEVLCIGAPPGAVETSPWEARYLPSGA
jgi:mannose-6-phosphate isomerase-like protein (cupin superfamily)